MNNIYQSITNIMQESIAIGKEKLNKQHGFKYRGIDDVMNTFYPLLSKHKVFIVPEVLEQQREERTAKSGGNLIYSIMKIKYTFYAEDGTSVSAIIVGEGMDSADKASNKAMAVGMKYAMFQVFCIPTEEMPDPDSETPPQTNPKSASKNESASTVEEEPEKPFNVATEPKLTLEEAFEIEVHTRDGYKKLKDLNEQQLEILIKHSTVKDWVEGARLILTFKSGQK